MSATPDRRLHPYRPGLAAAHLRGRVEAARFVEGTDFQVITPVADVRRHPAPDALLDTQLLMGEVFCVYDRDGAHVWGQAAADGYVGYVAATDLRRTITPPTHRVGVRATFAYAAPDIKSPVRASIGMNAKLTVTGPRDGFLDTTCGYVFASHLAPLSGGGPEPGGLEAGPQDFVDAARAFLDAPYLWGGRHAFGLDCSGLVQMALERTGQACPRDADMQESALGHAASTPYRHGDLIFWRGHVGIVTASALTASTLLHASAAHMRVVEEPLEPACARIADVAGPISAVRRLAEQP